MKKSLLYLLLLPLLWGFTACETPAPLPEDEFEEEPQPEPKPEFTFEGIEFLGGQAVYHGADEFYPDCGYVSLELWDVEPNPETGQVLGRFVKCKLYINLPSATFTGIPAGIYTVREGQGAPYVAAAGFDDGVNLPTGSYICDRTDGGFNLSMFVSGTIEVNRDGMVRFSLLTSGGEEIKGGLPEPLELVDLTFGFSPSTGGLSTLTEDMTLDLNGATEALLLDYGDYFGNGTRSVMVQILDTESLYGLVLDLILPAAEHNAPLPTGTFTEDKGYHNEFTFVRGGEQLGQPVGSYYCNFEWPDLYLGNLFGPAASGSVVVAEQNGRYTITVDWVDDAKVVHYISGSWSGEIVPYTEE